MKQKRIFILAYARANLGDDLFLAMLLKKYPNTHFEIYIQNQEHAKVLKNFSNITVYEKPEKELTKENAKDYDGYIYIGGSIFMEGGTVYNISKQFLEFMKECKKLEIPFYYVSSNFGPYYTEEYFELANQVFQNCTCINFRDKYSANLFSKIPTVHYLPDVIFSYKQEPKVEKIPNTVGITMIDLSIREKLLPYKNQYFTMLKQNIENYILQGKNVTIFSFCKHEGDEEAITEFLKLVPEQIKNKISTKFYRGNLEEFMKEYAKMEYMVCARFHAMVLSSVLEQKCEIMSYSKKIENVIEDLKLFPKKSILRFEELENTTLMPLCNFEKVDEKNIEAIQNEAQKQFYEISNFLKGGYVSI